MRNRVTDLVGGRQGRADDRIAYGWIDPIALKPGGSLVALFGLNKMSGVEEVVNWLPWEDKPGIVPRPIEDMDYVSMMMFAQERNWKITETMCVNAINKACRKNEYDPLKIYFNELTWDGVPRMEDVFDKTFGIPTDEKMKSACRILFMQGVQRALYPGADCKADVAVVLLGPQGTFKSTFVRHLSPVSRWFTENLPHDMASKDAKAHISGKFIIEMAEMFSMKKTDIQAIKAFLSATEDVYRPAYGRKDVSNPRRCIFIGTTNDSEIFADASGSRRFITIEVEKRANLQWLAENRDQIWAEAKVKYEAMRREGVPIVTAADEALHEEGNEEYKIDTETVYDTKMGEWSEAVKDKYFKLSHAILWLLPGVRLEEVEKHKKLVSAALRRAGFFPKSIYFPEAEDPRKLMRFWVSKKRLFVNRKQTAKAKLDDVYYPDGAAKIT
jgi:predicted P-loop ATPase